MIYQLSYAFSRDKKYLKLSLPSKKEVVAFLANKCKIWGKKLPPLTPTIKNMSGCDVRIKL